MIYQSVSINSVISRVIRNTRVQDTSYLFDMPEWIPEAMGYMKTKFVLTNKYKDITINFHKGLLPCELDHIKAVEYCGSRLREGNSVKDIRTGHSLNSETVVELAPVSTVETGLSVNANTIWNASFSEDVDTACRLPQHPSAYYQVEMGAIGTSFSDGEVRVHYRAMPVDSEGMPLIPDNEDYKQALYYYVRAMMGGAGYRDTVFAEGELMRRFEVHAARAVSAITYPSVDSMEHKVNTMTRLMPPENYFENFFRVDSGEGNYN